MNFSPLACMGIIVQTVLLSFFFSSYFLEALSSDNYSSNAVYTLQEKYFLGSSQDHLAAQAKMTLILAQNIFVPTKFYQKKLIT